MQICTDVCTSFALLMISFFSLTILVLLLAILSKQDFAVIANKVKCDSKGKNYYYSKVLKQGLDKINFLYKFNCDNFGEIFKLRSNENKTILLQSSFLIVVSPALYFLGVSIYKYQDDLPCFLGSFFFLAFAFVNLIISSISVYCAFLQPYRLPPNLYDLVNVASDYDEAHLKKMLIGCWTSSAKINYASNKRKMDLLHISRKYLLNCLCFLVVTLIYLVLERLLVTL